MLGNQPVESVTIRKLKGLKSLDDDFSVAKMTAAEEAFKAGVPYRSRFYTLLICDKGKCEIVVDHTSYELAANRVVFINYNQIFQFTEGGSFSARNILFTRSFYNRIYTGNRKIKTDTAFSDLPSLAEFSKPDFAAFIHTVKDIETEFQKDDVLSREIICLLLKTAMLKYIRCTGGGGFTGFRASRTLSYIEDFKSLVNIHFKELKRTSDYAAKLNITPNYLNSIVKDKADMSAEQFIRERVVLEAERLLLNTPLSVTEIAYELGFSDKSHFGKYFRKTTGESPARFRQKIMDENANFSAT